MAVTFLSHNLTSLHHVKKKVSQTQACDPLCHVTMSRTFHGKGFKRDLLIVHATPEAAEGLFSFLPRDAPWFTFLGAAMVAIPLGIQRLINLTNQVEAVAETVECLADRVGNVAADIDKVADDMLEKLPEGKLKDFVGRAEDLAEATAVEAQRVEDLMDKVEEMSNNMEDFLVETQKMAKADAKSEKK